MRISDWSSDVCSSNLARHKGSHVRKILKASRIKLFFLRSYSSDLNPANKCFPSSNGCWKRQTHEPPMPLWRSVGKLLELLTGHECANYIKVEAYADRKSPRLNYSN